MNLFSGRRVLAGCLLFIFVVMSGSGLHSTGYSLFAPSSRKVLISRKIEIFR